MPRQDAGAAVGVERFFQFSLLGLVASGYLAVAGSGYLDTPAIVLTSTGLLLRAVLVCGLFRLNLSDRLTTIVTIAYAAFFLADYFLLSRDFLAATVHLLFFLAVMKILTAKSNRDYLYTAVIAFLELLAAAILSINFNFFLFLALYLLFAIAALPAGEIRRSIGRSTVTARSGSNSFYPRLTLLSTLVTLGILTLTSGLFFILPRTAEAALSRLMAHRVFLPGFSNQVNLGDIGEIKTSSRPMMHIRIESSQAVGPMKWRGAALTDFDFGQRAIHDAVAHIDARVLPRSRVLPAFKRRRGRAQHHHRAFQLGPHHGHVAGVVARRLLLLVTLVVLLIHQNQTQIGRGGKDGRAGADDDGRFAAADAAPLVAALLRRERGIERGAFLA